MDNGSFKMLNKIKESNGTCINGYFSKCSKILNTFLFLLSNKMLVFRAGIHKMLILENMSQTGKTMIRLLLKKQSDLGLPSLSRLFRQASSV